MNYDLFQLLKNLRKQISMTNFIQFHYLQTQSDIVKNSPFICILMLKENIIYFVGALLEIVIRTVWRTAGEYLETLETIQCLKIQGG